MKGNRGRYESRYEIKLEKKILGLLILNDGLSDVRNSNYCSNWQSASTVK